ncbi:GTD2A protein, partial [Atractosteus spatula]|nr:GTD2A protein [Atractosteus spatula]
MSENLTAQFIQARPLLHYHFVTLLEEVNAAYGDIILHSEVRLLSLGKVLNRFLTSLLKIDHFLNDNGEGERFPDLKDKHNCKERKHVDDLLCRVESFKMLDCMLETCEGEPFTFPMEKMKELKPFQNLRLLSAKILFIFASTYIFGCTFSAMCRIKSHFHACLRDFQLESQLH